MAKKAVTDAVVAKLAAEFTLGTVLDRNIDLQTPDDGSAFVRVEFPVSQNSQAALHTRYRETGAFRVVVATEIGAGITKSQTWCEAIEAIFRNQKFSDVYCMAPSIRDGIDEGVYFVAAVIVPYRYEYSGS
jgi:hypothetical protein